jgi:NhaP-type Na+/H+ or K+/H+ antiporter
MKVTELPGTKYMLNIFLLFSLAVALSITTNIGVSTIILVACIVLCVTMVWVPLLFLIADKEKTSRERNRRILILSVFGAVAINSGLTLYWNFVI